MNEKSRNMYLKMAQLACRNVKAAICRENGIVDEQGEPDVSQIRIMIKDKEGLLVIVGNIMQSPESAETIFSNRVKQRLVVMTDAKILHQVDIAGIFINSILLSRSARICQKQLVNYLMAERYLDAAWDYDVQHKTMDSQMENLELAKKVLIDRYSFNFIGGFTFDGRPLIEPSILQGLKRQAFDSRYSLMTEDRVNALVDRRYERDFAGRSDVFVAHNPTAYIVSTVKDASQKSMMDVFLRKAKLSETEIISQLYEASFVDMPLQKRRRRFVNLRSRNRDVEICPLSHLSVKKQFSQIEAATKHEYIMHYFDDNYETQVDRAKYYFDQEAWMYKYIWQVDGTIYSQNGKIYLPGDKVVDVPESMADYEFFHRINTVYAALFGFTPEDAVGGNNWLIDSIRSAYTDEGNALYRLTIIDKRIAEIKKEREEQNKW